MKPVSLALCLLPCLLLAEDPPASESSINAGFNLTRGDQDTVLFELGGETLHPFGDQSIYVEASYAYGQTEAEEEDITTRDTSNALIRYENKLHDPWFAYAEATSLSDEIANIDYRITVGPGLGTRLVQTDTLDVAAESGLVWVVEDIDNETDDEGAVRLGQSLTWDISKTATLRQTLDFLRKFNRTNDRIVNARIIVTSTLTESLSLRFDLRHRYESQPAEDKESNNLTFTAGIALTL